MSSVTGRIKEIKQPWGGYINPSQFEDIKLDDNKTLLENENIHPTVIGITVDYLTRFILSKDVKVAFKISIMGYAFRVLVLGKDIITKDKQKKIDIITLLNNINGLDDNSIISACKVCTYDVWYRNLKGATSARGAEETVPDNNTITNIRIMVERSLSFWKEYGPIVAGGFTFEKDGYTKTVDSGDGDYLTEDTLWDFKVSKSKITSKHTLQLLMYWIMGQHSGKKEFKNITKLGVFNPRLNRIYLLEINKVPEFIIQQVEKEVICYE